MQPAARPAEGGTTSKSEAGRTLRQQAANSRKRQQASAVQSPPTPAGGAPARMDFRFGEAYEGRVKTLTEAPSVTAVTE
jgi:hypothetical protein